MALTIVHPKVNQIADWTQADLDAQIALGNFPPSTLISDITLASDWNQDHTVTGTIEQSQNNVAVDGVTITGDGTPGDPLVAVSSGSGSAVVSSIAQAAHGFSVSDVLYLAGATYTLAMADDVVSAEVVGMVSAVADANNFSLTTEGRVTGLAGLTAGTVYFLSPTSAGDMTSTQPSTVGQVVKPLFVADSTTSGYFNNYRGELITPISGGVNLYIQDDAPTDIGKYLWIETTGGDLSFWVEDGV